MLLPIRPKRNAIALFLTELELSDNVGVSVIGSLLYASFQTAPLTALPYFEITGNLAVRV